MMQNHPVFVRREYRASAAISGGVFLFRLTDSAGEKTEPAPRHPFTDGLVRVNGTCIIVALLICERPVYRLFQ